MGRVYCRSAVSIPVEYASQRRIREYNKLYYRFNHWLIWIFVFFIAPGPLTDLQGALRQIHWASAWLIDHLRAHPDFIYPENRRNEVLGFLKSQKLGDLCNLRLT